MSLIHRNLRVFFRDIAGVCLSLLASLVLFVLYVGFLGGIQVEALQERFPNATAEDIDWFVSTWVFSGIVMITTLTTGVSALSTFVQDRASSRYKDFLVAPVRGWQLIAGYMLSSALIAVLMSSIVLIVGQSYLFIRGYAAVSPLQLAQVLGTIVLLSVTFAGIASFVVTFIKSNGAFTALGTVVGTVAGFLAGAYLPLGVLPANVVNTMNALPFSQAAMLVRLPLTDAAMQNLTGSQAQATEALSAFYGITLSVNNWSISPSTAALALVGLLIVFSTLASVRIRAVLLKQ